MTKAFEAAGKPSFDGLGVSLFEAEVAQVPVRRPLANEVVCDDYNGVRHDYRGLAPGPHGS